MMGTRSATRHVFFVCRTLSRAQSGMRSSGGDSGGVGDDWDCVCVNDNDCSRGGGTSAGVGAGGNSSGEDSRRGSCGGGGGGSKARAPGGSSNSMAYGRAPEGGSSVQG